MPPQDQKRAFSGDIGGLSALSCSRVASAEADVFGPEVVAAFCVAQRSKGMVCQRLAIPFGCAEKAATLEVGFGGASPTLLYPVQLRQCAYDRTST